MMKVNPFQDGETKRQQRNLTNPQKRNNIYTKEGVVVNSFVKNNEINLNETKDTYIISDEVQMPEQLYNDRQIIDKKLLPLSAIALGVMGSIAVITAFANRSAKIASNLAKEKWLPAVTRNVNLNEETHQVIYQMIQNPNRKTFVAGAGVLALSAMAFMGKTFFDGYKEIWVKRQEANIHKNLQENLIKVETESFSGKMQIIRSMLSKYTSDFEKYLTFKETEPQNFGRRKLADFPFTSKRKETSDKFALGNIFVGIGTVVGIAGLGFLSLRNLAKSKIHLQNYIKETQNGIRKIIENSTETTKKTDQNNLIHLFLEADASENFVKEQVAKLNWSQEEKTDFIKKVMAKINMSATKVNPNIGGDGTPKPAFNSFVNDYKAFFYNWLLDTANPQFKHLFLGITGITALSYGGKLAGDALKEVQVKKINAETELELQKRLVSTELRNFKAKKDSAIAPLVMEFYKQVDSGEKSKEELKTMAENILFEIKNGPPFVYS